MSNDALRERVAETLATYGQDVHPHAEIIEIERPTPGTQTGVVILERITGEKPEYCVHGYAECVQCQRMCFLGSETVKVVTDPDRTVVPLCMECAHELIPRDSLQQPVEHLHDHRRADGPHE